MAITGLRLPRRSETGPYTNPPTAHAISIAEATAAASRVVNPCCDTRNGTPHRPANVSMIPEKAPGIARMSHVLR